MDWDLVADRLEEGAETPNSAYHTPEDYALYSVIYRLANALRQLKD